MADHRSNTYIIELFRRSRLVRHWVPVFIWMAGIFYFSSRPDPLSFLRSSGHSSGIDKLAHIGEYAGLVVLLHRALKGPGSPSARLRTGGGAGEQGSRGAREQGSQGEFSSAPPHPSTHAQKAPSQLSSSALIAFTYAVFDELHQELTASRGFELADIGYDLLGIIAALGLIWFRKRGEWKGKERMNYRG